MATDPRRLPLTSPGARSASDRTRRRAWIALGVLAFALFAWILSFAETGVDEVRVANPNPPNPLAPIEWAGRGVTDFWVPIFYGVTFAVMGLLGWIFWRHWRQTGRAHAGLPIFVALGVVGLIGDPIFNWAMYCNYHPGLLHWPVNWDLFDVAPTVEPLWIVMGAYQVFFLAPAIGAFALYRRFVENRIKPSSWVRRHPAWSLLIFATVLGFGMDILMEQWMLNMRIYKYTQIAGPEMTWGHGHLQLFEIIWIGALIGFYAFLLQRDDTGATVCKRISLSVGPLRRLGVGEWGAAFLVVAVSLALYGAFWATLRETGRATHIAAGTYPYRAVKTYDPDGRMRAAGQPGPYFPGTWCLGAGCKPD
jgi:hypothetical protein